MDFRVRTDLACESMAELGRALPASKYRERRVKDFCFCYLQIEDDADSALVGRPIGSYLTVECGGVLSAGAREEQLLSELLAQELRRMAGKLTGRAPDAELNVFVVGLGNAELTAEAIGPRAVGLLTATRHLREHEPALYRKLGCASLSALSPGVLGQTGIEALELIRGATEHVHPDLVVVIDALAARSCERLSATVQISDAGIHPGSGVGNRREGITRDSVGVPVIAIGVPTVVDSATLVYDALTRAGIHEFSPELKNVLESGRSFFVSPKDSDAVTEHFSQILANAVNLAFVGTLLD
jgi:spore protease